MSSHGIFEKDAGAVALDVEHYRVWIRNMEHPDVLGIVGGVEITEDSVGICPGENFAVRVHNTLPVTCLCSVRAFVKIGSPQWEVTFQMAAGEDRTISKVEGAGDELQFPAIGAVGSLSIHVELAPAESQGLGAPDHETVFESILLRNVSPSMEPASIASKEDVAKAVVERTIWDEYISALWPHEPDQGIAWHVWNGSTPEVVAEQMEWMVNDSVDEAREDLERFRNEELGPLKEKIENATARVQAYVAGASEIA